MHPRSSRRAYLDYNATAPVRPEVRAVAEPILFGDPTAGGFGNASSIHWAGRAARRHLEAARTAIARRSNRKPSEVIFTSGGTEADNLALRGVLLHPRERRRRLVISAVEHPAVAEAARQLEGVEVVLVPVDAEGRLDLGALAEALHTPTALVSLMAANNETGVVLPIAEARALTRAAGTWLHVDAVQAAGRLPLDWDADLLTLSGHKLGGLKGAGALLVREGVPLVPQVVGGAQERGRRAGTESVAALVGLAAALELALDGLEAEGRRLATLRDDLEAGLRALPGVSIIGGGAPRLPNTSLALFASAEADALLMALDLEGVAASTGSACSSGSVEASPVLLAMGVPRAQARSALRFSLGWASTRADVERVLEVLPALLDRVRSSAGG